MTGDGEHGCLGAQGPTKRELRSTASRGCTWAYVWHSHLVMTALKEMLVRHVGAGTVPGAVALLVSIWLTTFSASSG